MTRPPRSCECGSVHAYGTRCPIAVARREQRRGTRDERGYGSEWQARSKRIIARDGGQCQLRLPGCTGIATTTDHVIAKVNGGTDDDYNLQGSCRSCNSSKGTR